MIEGRGFMADIALEKSKGFAVEMVRLYQYLCSEKREYVMGRQILRSGTSIGANLTEAAYAYSLRDHAAKKSIALKECAETVYWLELLHDTGFISDDAFISRSVECVEILKLLSSAVKTLKKRIKGKGK
jgi:four helix bundle protein